MQLGRASWTAIGFSLLLVGVNVGSLRAQSILEGKATGTVKSEDGVPLPGAAVEISSPSLIAGTRSTTSPAVETGLRVLSPCGVAS